MDLCRYSNPLIQRQRPQFGKGFGKAAMCGQENGQPKVSGPVSVDRTRVEGLATEFCDREGLIAEADLFRKEWAALKK